VALAVFRKRAGKGEGGMIGRAVMSIQKRDARSHTEQKKGLYKHESPSLTSAFPDVDKEHEAAAGMCSNWAQSKR
jgi:hypothetical protein